MIRFRAFVAGGALLALTAGTASAQNAYCDSHARDYASSAANVGGNMASGALFGAFAGAIIGGVTGDGDGDRVAAGAGIGAAAGAGLGAAGSSQSYQNAYQQAYAACMNQSAQPVAGGDACEVGSAAWYSYCQGKFRSFNPSTGTYRGFDGLDHFCLPNYC